MLKLAEKVFVLLKARDLGITPSVYPFNPSTSWCDLAGSLPGLTLEKLSESLDLSSHKSFIDYLRTDVDEDEGLSECDHVLLEDIYSSTFAIKNDEDSHRLLSVFLRDISEHVFIYDAPCSYESELPLRIYMAIEDQRAIGDQKLGIFFRSYLDLLVNLSSQEDKV